jgi:uncharacterized protein with PQ loop repeat
MQIIHLIYITSAAMAIIACIPQLRQLIQTKQSDEFKLSTWVVWLGAQAVSSIYAISVDDPLYLIVSTGWFAFYALMVVLIVRYRRTETVIATDNPIKEA